MEIIVPNPVLAPPTLGANRRLTKAFIDANPVTLTLIPRTRQKKAAGGWAWVEQTPRDPQVMTLIEQTGLSGEPRPQVTMDGVEREVEFQLLGEWDSVIARGDVFTHSGKDWEVIDLYIDNGYETRAMVSARG